MANEDKKTMQCFKDTDMPKIQIITDEASIKIWRRKKCTLLLSHL